METQVDEESQQAPHLPVDALHLPQAGAELPVEPEHVVAVQVVDELRDVRGNRLAHAHPVGTRHRRLVGIANHRVRRRPRRRHALGRRQPLGGDRFRRLPRRDVRAGHAPRQLDRVAPERSKPSRAAHREPNPRLTLHRLVVVRRLGPATRGDQRRERARRAAPREREPFLLRLRRGDADEQTDLRPRDRAFVEGAGDSGQLGEPSRDVGQLLELAPGDAQTLAGVVTQLREAELVMAVAPEKSIRETAEDPAAGRILAGKPPEVAVEDLRAVGAMQVAVFRRLENLSRHQHRGED